MRVRMDRVGRVVIPKPLRDLLGITDESEFEVSRDGAGLHLELVAGQGREVVEVDGLPLLRSVPGHVLSDSDVARLRDSDQR